MSFSFARQEGFPTQYSAHETPVTVDVLEAGFVAAFIILIISFFISIPTTNASTNFRVYLRVTVTLLIGLFIMLCNFGQEWEVGSVKSKMPYRAGTSEEIDASMGIKIGLRSVNVTLQSKPKADGKLANEIINYNERFEWTWDQGRFGFGPYSGHLQQEFRAAQYRGLPTPILWAMDYFVIDGEGFRFGRFFRTAGWYCHILLWTAFSCWLLAVILFRSVLRYGAYCLGMAGILQLVANLVWLVVRNPVLLVIPFEDGNITTKFGGSYWLNFATGIISIAIAVTVIIMDHKFDTYLYTFFDVDPLNTYDEVAYLTKTEQLQLRNKSQKKSTKDVPLVEMPASGSVEEDEDEVYLPVYLKRHTKLIAPPVVRSNKPRHLMNQN